MLCESEESLSRLLAWARPQAVFSDFTGPQAVLCFKAGLQVGLQGCPRTLSGSLVIQGQRLYLIVGQGCWLGSLPKRGYRMGSTAARVLCLSFLVR